LSGFIQLITSNFLYTSIHLYMLVCMYVYIYVRMYVCMYDDDDIDEDVPMSKDDLYRAQTCTR